MARHLVIDDFRLGLRRDANLNVERIPSLYTVKNYQYLRAGNKVKLKTRKGYTRFNDTALAATATQLFWFKDLKGNDPHLLGILDDANHNGQWYKIAESGAHTRIDTQIATARQPVVQVKNRVFFGTDEDGATATLMWADNTSIGAGTSYRVGIAKPSFDPTITEWPSNGHIDSVDYAEEMNDDDATKLAIQYDVGASDEVISGINVYVRLSTANLSGTEEGSWTCKIYTDDSGEPSDTLLDYAAVSYPNEVTDWTDNTYEYQTFTFQLPITLPASTTVWFVFEGDSRYNYHYYVTGPAYWYANIASEGATGNHTYGPIFEYDSGTSTWSASPTDGEGIFYFSSLDTTIAYGYVITYYNSTYGIESRPSKEIRTTLLDSEKIFAVSTPATADAQVDKVRLYRREMADIDDAESNITDTYKFVAEDDEGATFYDWYATSALGGELQTENHYLFDETDDGDDAIREAALVPKGGCVWKQRFIFYIANSNNLYFSKRLEEDGATGQTGDAVYDFIPLENVQEMPVAAAINGIRPIGNSQLIIYYDDESISIIRGMNEVLNPPSDISIDTFQSNLGLFAPQSLASLKERHIYMSSDGVYIFNGTVNQEHASLNIQSIFSAIENEYLDDTVITVNGNEVWVLVDDDNDGDLESFYILDLQHPEVPWRLYDYGTSFYDVVLRRTGGTFKTLLAADAESNYILELETGTTDNGGGIDTSIDTHWIEVPGEIAIGQVELLGYYPTTPLGYFVTIQDHEGNESVYNISPKSSSDIRGRRTGCRILTANRLKITVDSTSIQADELHALVLEYQI